jgi:hypothetical protein
MRKLAAAALTSIALTGIVRAEAPAPDPNVAEAKAIIEEFFSTLKGELKAAIMQGGPVNAITVCQRRAPSIALELSEKTGWEVGRTSLKLRNASLNAPDAWELKVLEQFEVRKAEGEDVKTMAYSEVVEEDGKKAFRFMKAVPTGKVCLNCHGTEITPEVIEALDAAYPQDQARGYELGDIRGAFTLSKPL